MTPSKPPVVRPTRALPFDQLPWNDFERLRLMLLPREGLEDPQHHIVARFLSGQALIEATTNHAQHLKRPPV